MLAGPRRNYGVLRIFHRCPSPTRLFSSSSVKERVFSRVKSQNPRTPHVSWTICCAKLGHTTCRRLDPSYNQSKSGDKGAAMQHVGGLVQTGFMGRMAATTDGDVRTRPKKKWRQPRYAEHYPRWGTFKGNSQKYIAVTTTISNMLVVTIDILLSVGIQPFP